MVNGNGSMKPRNAIAGQHQRNSDGPPASNTNPASAGNSDSASSASISERPANSRTVSAAASTGRPHQLGCQRAASQPARRDHSTAAANAGTRKPCEYCGSDDQRSTIVASVGQ